MQTQQTALNGTVSTRRMLLDRAPDGDLTTGHFRMSTDVLAQPADGEVLTRTLYLSVDPVMRKIMTNRTSEPNGLNGVFGLGAGDPMRGRTVGVVEVSNDPKFSAGDFVLGWGGWQDFAIEKASALVAVAPVAGQPLSVHLGPLGRPGITAWLGIVLTAKVEASDTVLVSSAAGAVGSVAGQLAKSRGARVVGIAGGAEKCEWLVSTLGFDAAVDYKSADFLQQLEEATPDGVSVIHENVGGAVLDAGLGRMSAEGRIALCGLLDGYQAGIGEAFAYKNFGLLLDRGLTLTGFRIDELTGHHQQALVELRGSLESGSIVTTETVTEGLENAPDALVGLLAGKGSGKHLVKVDDSFDR
ncbi:MAG: putative oxidoreductase YncB [Microbacteriaceae bacterium]|nr:putative oxidoreductase YncB [Microbacteriaceae bacterium]